MVLIMTLNSPTVSSRFDTVGEFPEQRAYVYHSTEYKELPRLRLNSPTVSCSQKAHAAENRIVLNRAPG